jgi:nicotinamide-nucleotide amidase
MTVSTAESCTGGLLASSLTDIQGASIWYKQGWITYSNDSKVDQLGVKSELFEENEGNAGAVSADVAKAMAEGAARNSSSDIAISVTGIAGPTGGTETKEVGLVWVGVKIGDAVEAKTASFGQGDRSSNKEAFANFALRTALEVWDEHFEEPEPTPEISEESELEEGEQPELDDALRTVDGDDANWDREVEWVDGAPPVVEPDENENADILDSDIKWGEE